MIYENVRGEALQNLEPASWAMERVRQYGVAGLLPGFQNDFPFVLYAHSVPRPAWSGNTDFHREKLHQVYEFLITARVETQAGEEAEPIPNTFDASRSFSTCNADVCSMSTGSGLEIFIPLQGVD